MITDTDTDDTIITDEASALRNETPYLVVRNGASIQDAVNRAGTGTAIFIEPGLYKESIVVNKQGIQLIGIKKSGKEIIIENPGKEENGIRVTDEGDGFILRNITVQNFSAYGVFLLKVNNFILDHVKCINNKEFGLFTVMCNHGSIKYCSATGSTDTGIYTGQSSSITVAFNVAFGNVSGFEIENCTDVKAFCNEAYENSAGLAVFLLPQLAVKTSSNILVSNNDIHNNNRPNIPTGGGLEDFIPSGCGILLVGADNVTIQKNMVTNNNFVGIAAVSTAVLGKLANIPPEAFDIDPNPDGIKIIENVMMKNGFAAPPGLPFPPADLLWDGSGKNNCWSHNICTSSYPKSLPACK